MADCLATGLTLTQITYNNYTEKMCNLPKNTSGSLQNMFAIYMEAIWGTGCEKFIGRRVECKLPGYEFIGVILSIQDLKASEGYKNVIVQMDPTIWIGKILPVFAGYYLGVSGIIRTVPLFKPKKNGDVSTNDIQIFLINQF
jgi:hypothetical protein